MCLKIISRVSQNLNDFLIDHKRMFAKFIIWFGSILSPIYRSLCAQRQRVRKRFASVSVRQELQQCLQLLNNT